MNSLDSGNQNSSRPKYSFYNRMRSFIRRSQDADQMISFFIEFSKGLFGGSSFHCEIDTYRCCAKISSISKNDFVGSSLNVISGLKVHNPGGLKVHTSTSLASNPKGCGDVAGRRVPHVKRPLQTGIEHQRDCPSNGLQSQDRKQICESESFYSIQEAISKAKQAGFLQGLYYIIQRLNSGPLTACRIYREI